MLPGMQVFALLSSALLIASVSGTGASAKRKRAALPPGASAVISQVAALSAKGDLQSIRALMTNEFVWSFGGDDRADTAIDVWRRDQRYSRALTHVLKMPCRPADYNGVPGVECPGKGGLSFRAWFMTTPEGWKFTAFVEGD